MAKLPAPPSSPESKSAFFSEEKKQKTFDFSVRYFPAAYRPESTGAHGAIATVALWQERLITNARNQQKM
jgi:hypothetical protein